MHLMDDLKNDRSNGRCGHCEVRGASEYARLMCRGLVLGGAARHVTRVNQLTRVEIYDLGLTLVVAAKRDREITPMRRIGRGNHIARRHDGAHEQGQERYGSQMPSQAAHAGKDIRLPSVTRITLR